MSKNIYKLFREYNKLNSETDKSKYLASLNFNTRETFRSLIAYANNSDRFESIYDGWINSLEEEFVVLEVYSVIINTRRSLENFCVKDDVYNKFIEQKKNILVMLLENNQYEDALSLLNVHMFSEDFKQNKLDELREAVLEYLFEKKMVLPKKLINEIYTWVDKLAVPPYLLTDICGDFTFTITNDILSITTLQEDVEDSCKKQSDLKKFVDNLVQNYQVSK